MKGVLFYFGKVDGDEDGQAKLDKWLGDRDDLFGGRKPRIRGGDELKVEDLCNNFMAFTAELGVEIQMIRSILIKDLKQRRLLDETLVIWGGEFGRTPMNEVRRGNTPGKEGRDFRLTDVGGRVVEKLLV